MNIVRGFLLLLTLDHMNVGSNGESSRKSKYVKTQLEAKWKQTPFILETSEYLSSEDENYFWSYIDRVSDIPAEQLSAQTTRDKYLFAIDTASQWLSPAKLNLLKFSLSLRVYSPTVEMFQQIAESQDLPDCECVVDINSEFTCSIENIPELISSAKNRNISAIYKVDHRYNKNLASDVVAVLYGEVGTACFTRFHTKLKQVSAADNMSYILRHYLHKRSGEQVRLSGYGVELAIKSTEYKAKDDTKVSAEDDAFHSELEDREEEDIEGFYFTKLRQLHPELSEKLADYRTYLQDSLQELAPLKVWQMQDLSLQVAQRVLSAPEEESLRLLKDLSQNFPSQARSLCRVRVEKEMKAEMRNNQKFFENRHGLGPGQSALFINGLHLDLETTDIFSILDTLRAEYTIMQGLHSLGYRDAALGNLLRLDVKPEDDEARYAVDVRTPAVIYMNDLKNDARYNDWPSGMQEMLRPTFPGMLRHIRENFFHLVLVVNPVERDSREMIKLAESFYVHRAPVRIGFVFVLNPDETLGADTDASLALYSAFMFLRKHKSPHKALDFITDLYAKYEDAALDAAMVREYFQAKFGTSDITKVFSSSSDYVANRSEGADFLQATGLDLNLPKALLNGVPLDKTYLDPEKFEDGILTQIMMDTPTIQRQIYNGELRDNMDVLDFLMSQPNVMPRLNQRFLQPGAMYLDYTAQLDSQTLKDAARFTSLRTNSEKTVWLSSRLKYMTKRDDYDVRPVTLWVVVDLETSSGRLMLYRAIKHVKSYNNVRLTVVHNPSTPPRKHSHRISLAVQAALETLNRNFNKLFITKLVKEENAEELSSGRQSASSLDVSGMNVVVYKDHLVEQEEAMLDMIDIHREFSEAVLGFAPGHMGIVANGKVFGPFRADEVMFAEDFQLLEKVVMKAAAANVRQVVEGVARPSGDDDVASRWEDYHSEMVMRTSALLLANYADKSRVELTYNGDAHSVLVLPPLDQHQPAYELEAVLDPVSREAQYLAPILQVLQDVINVRIKVFMNCQEKLSEMPLKSFYRYVLLSEPVFSAGGELASGRISARFSDVPHTPILTLALHTPESWLVECVHAVHDLDNIHLQEVEHGVFGTFELEYLLLEGHCYEQLSGQPPRGLQFTIGTPAEPVQLDTIVMANLGYFQLKANPGAWVLRLREGRSSQIYDIISHEGTDTPKQASDVMAVISNFQSKIIRIKVGKKPDHLTESLLEDDSDKQASIWDSLSSTFTPGSATGQESDMDKTLNIFSVATGHLYERLLRIMMLSVLKHTKSPVKFWFLKNFLSPSFKKFLPYLSREYGFEYELVQYKWPRWLTQQKEKQRIIWGYKILFLDVLFPLDVKKFIFVDADQIVRTDLQELSDLDLDGAPYAYTPFCDDKKEMDGFRFWKSGYWANHLGHRKYHISALYVVDLKKFRKIAAGDRLRGQYQGLSQDPNSLSNLDQDLPNNMIHQVSIKSLPQEWLWCETWCNDDAKARAKTIDLCNNPLTKESKLQAAQRIVPEWKEYDEEMKRLQERFAQELDAAVTGDRDADASDDGREEEIVEQFEEDDLPELPDSPVPETKPGRCPHIPDGVMGACAEMCGSDSDCEGSDKCCSNGCGHTCQKPDLHTEL